MIFDPGTLPPRDFYRVMLGTIVPRPIAWVSTLSVDGVANIAPFSFFNGVTSRPPTISIAIGSRKWEGDVVPKDTLRNIEETKEFVVHATTEALAEVANRSSAEFPPDVSEIAELGLTATPSVKVKPLRILESPIAFECVLDRVVHVGEAPSTGLVLGVIVLAHVSEAVLDADSQAVDVTKLRPVARLGGEWWAPVREQFRLQRPDWAAKGFKG
jgi:flavin reductase (DIM6/NTAB) family NADH-FMN oxidoreductase RutF